MKITPCLPRGYMMIIKNCSVSFCDNTSNLVRCGLEETILCKPHQVMWYKYGSATPVFKCKRCQTSYIFIGKRYGSSSIYCNNCNEIFKQFAARYRSEGTGSGGYGAHGLSVWDYYDLWKSQNGECAICHLKPNPNDPSRFKRTLHIDHDHSCCDNPKGSCGKCIRGLLCRSCNVMLGHYEKHEGILVIEQFENYLKESREK